MNYIGVKSLYLCRPCAFSYDNFFHVLTTSFNMGNSQLRAHKETGDNSAMWVDYEMLDIISTFICEDNLDHALNEVSPSSD